MKLKNLSEAAKQMIGLQATKTAVYGFSSPLSEKSLIKIGECVLKAINDNRLKDLDEEVLTELLEKVINDPKKQAILNQKKQASSAEYAKQKADFPDGI